VRFSAPQPAPQPAPQTARETRTRNRIANRTLARADRERLKGDVLTVPLAIRFCAVVLRPRVPSSQRA